MKFDAGEVVDNAPGEKLLKTVCLGAWRRRTGLKPGVNGSGSSGLVGDGEVAVINAGGWPRGGGFRRLIFSSIMQASYGAGWGKSS